MNKHVYVGMSGGVDSSVTAALLIDQGYKVTGVYMKNWTQDLPGMICPWAEDLADAKRVAVQLGIDLKVYDFEQQYRDRVVGYMIDAYRDGYTPNPDIMCNQEIKFKLFLDAALEDGADLVATGHYAATKDGQLLQAKDETKDQTYFLYRVSKAALDKTLFPLGELEKPQVREIAKEKGLFTASKKDSQGICFVGKVGIREFLNQYVETKPGPIIEKETGKKLGEHDGAIYFTVGQRHGLNVGGGLPYYVVGKDMEANEVYVSTNLQDDSIWRDKTILTSIHAIDGTDIEDGEYQARIRHRAKLANVNKVGDELHFKDAQRALAPGQSVVLYKDNLCVGGGIISQ